MRNSLALAAILTIASAVHAATPARCPSGTPVVNINTATHEQIAMLPGIGDKIATAIYDFAEAGDPANPPKSNDCDHKCHFRTVDDLLKVKGIGTKKLAALRPYVTVSCPTTATAKIRIPKPAPAAK